MRKKVVKLEVGAVVSVIGLMTLAAGMANDDPVIASVGGVITVAGVTKLLS